MIICASHINFLINPGDLHVYSNMNVMGNTTPAGVEQPATVYFYKHTMPPASLLPLTSVNGKETACLTSGLQPHSMWLKPVTLMKSANRQLPACRTGRKQTAIEIHNQMYNFEPLRIQSELQNSTELRFTVESLNGFTRSGLQVTAQDNAQDAAQVTPQDKFLADNAIGHDGLGKIHNTAQDTAQVRDLIMNVDGEMNRDEIQKKLKLTHRENFRKFYLKPALESGLIEMTIPGKPNSRYQKYRLTEKGKQMKNKA
jgi:hypothetical protein